MPLGAEEVLLRLTQATEDARTATRRLHEEIADAKQVRKAQRTTIAELIVNEITGQVAQLADETRATMAAAVEKVIDELRTDWRARLGLEP